ncbi:MULTISPECIES: entericidin A/B family lipoprotein [Hydrogenophaga]|uniref:Entericidin A/B family lipoprotein n=2 Tax=Hydrogenophaga TaxID=47420 RepID=A0ABW2QMW9_9BURK
MKTIATLIAAAFLLALAGCNTMAGIGKDVQKAGSAVENAAKK